ncbi:serine protease [Aspergillus undulatus]|uniref:serine protease n=1 Tax=Aspergillus undulatus TaxID=1810928 RepID=UPI003CCDC790
MAYPRKQRLLGAFDCAFLEPAAVASSPSVPFKSYIKLRQSHLSLCPPIQQRLASLHKPHPSSPRLQVHQTDKTTAKMKYALKATVLSLSLASTALAAENIVGGDEASISDYPYQIALLSSGSLICGGSIISNQYVVTAAHCTDGATARSLSIRAGSSSSNSGGTVVGVSSIAQHPDYNSATVDNDISILTLSEELTFGDGIGAVDLPSSSALPAAGTVGTLTGWGALREGGNVSPTLQYVDVPVVSKSQCSSDYQGFNEITDSMVCAGVEGGGKDACQGDSGGPYVADGVLIGITSWGNGCAREGYPGVYSSPAYFRDYIQSVTGL